MKLEWMGEYRDVLEQLIKYCNVYASIYNKEILRAEDVSFSFAQIQVVEYLLENEELNQNMMTIAARLGITSSTFSKLVARLVKKGMLKKFHMQGNRKDIVVRVTPMGQRVYDAYAARVVERHFGRMFGAAKDIPREYLPLFAQMLGAGLPRVVETPADEEKRVLIPVREKN